MQVDRQSQPLRMLSARFTLRSQKLWKLWPQKNPATQPADLVMGFLPLKITHKGSLDQVKIHCLDQLFFFFLRTHCISTHRFIYLCFGSLNVAAKHPYPFNDSVVIYIRHIGPGVCVGQAWQEGKEVQQVPQRLCSDILMVKQ